MNLFSSMTRVAAVALVAAAITTTASAKEWLTNYDEALKQAKAEKKPILVNFTGSDWCGWCVRLKEEVFTKPKFKKFAEKHLVLLEVDFPRKIQLSADVKAQNDKLGQQFAVRGYPTIVLLDEDGKEIERGGYQEGGPSKFLKQFKQLKDVK